MWFNSAFKELNCDFFKYDSSKLHNLATCSCQDKKDSICTSTPPTRLHIVGRENSIFYQSTVCWYSSDVGIDEDCLGKKVKVTLLQALRLCTGRTAHRGSRGIALLFHDHGTRRGWGVSDTPQPLFTPWKNPVPIVQKAGWAPGPVWTGAENLVPTGIRSPDRPARS